MRAQLEGGGERPVPPILIKNRGGIIQDHKYDIVFLMLLRLRYYAGGLEFPTPTCPRHSSAIAHRGGWV